VSVIFCDVHVLTRRVVPVLLDQSFFVRLRVIRLYRICCLAVGERSQSIIIATTVANVEAVFEFHIHADAGDISYSRYDAASVLVIEGTHVSHVHSNGS